MRKFKIAVIVGSNRRESINRRLGEAIARLAAPKFDVVWARIDDLPMYNQDQETPLPESVARFKAEVEGADGILIVTPEHSRSVPAVLKNAIDWGARPWGHNSWAGKTAAITGASPGGIGTAVAQQHLRQMLGVLGVLVAGGEAYITFKPELVDAGGNVTDDSTRAFLRGFVDQFAALLQRLQPARQAAA